MAIKNGRYKDSNGNVRHFETNEYMVVVDDGQSTLKQKLSSLLGSISALWDKISLLSTDTDSKITSLTESVDKKITQEKITLTLLNGWTSVNGVELMIHKVGSLGFLTGAITSSQEMSIDHIAYIPNGYLPKTRVNSFIEVDESPKYISVSQRGVIHIEGSIPANAEVSINVCLGEIG